MSCGKTMENTPHLTHIAEQATRAARPASTCAPSATPGGSQHLQARKPAPHAQLESKCPRGHTHSYFLIRSYEFTLSTGICTGYHPARGCHPCIHKIYPSLQPKHPSTRSCNPNIHLSIPCDPSHNTTKNMHTYFIPPRMISTASRAPYQSCVASQLPNQPPYTNPPNHQPTNPLTNQ